MTTRNEDRPEYFQIDMDDGSHHGYVRQDIHDAVIRQRDALRSICREMLPYVERASEAIFPNLADNEAIAEDARAAIAACEEKPE